MKQFHLRPDGLPPVNGYSHAITAGGRIIVVSGQVPLDSNGKLVGADDAEQQTVQVFTNIAAALAAAGAGMQDVVKLTVYLTDRADLDSFRRARDRYIDAEEPPASSLVLVNGLIHPSFRVEIDALAVI